MLFPPYDVYCVCQGVIKLLPYITLFNHIDRWTSSVHIINTRKQPILTNCNCPKTPVSRNFLYCTYICFLNELRNTNQNNKVFVQNIQTILANCNMTNKFYFHLITIFNDSRTFAENTGCICFDHSSRNFALGQLNCRVVETMLILRTSLIKISHSLDPCTILRLTIMIIYLTMY